MLIVYDVIEFPLSAGNDHYIKTFTPEYATVGTATWSGTEAIIMQEAVLLVYGPHPITLEPLYLKQ
jgi:hypothetical protein